MFFKRVQGVVNRREFYVSTIILFGVALVFQLDLLVKLPIVSNDSAANSGGLHLGKKTADQHVDVHPSISSSRKVQVGENKVTWGKNAPPLTKLLQHAEGWTMFDNLYMLDGTIFIVTDTPDTFPERRLMISSGYPIYNSDEETSKREPTDADLQIISPQQAKKLFGNAAARIDGVNVLATEPKQFVNHYYHFAAELLTGMWRTYTSIDPKVGNTGRSTLQPVKRLIFPHIKTDEWRDYAKMNQYVIHGAFPGLAMEFEQDWLDRAEVNRPWIFDRVVLGDRAASIRGQPFLSTQRFASSAFNLPGGPNWWLPVRNAMAEFVGLDKSVGSSTSSKPVLTYVSRQDWGRRMLKPEDHESLVRALKRLETEKGYEVNIVSMDKLSREEQIKLAARTTIMMGVHGNGLTSLVWMNPTPRSTVIEFFYPGGFTFDYEWTTRAMGMTHYGFWGKSHFTSPDLPPVAYPEGFQGNEIPIDGDAVADLIVRRIELDD